MDKLYGNPAESRSVLRGQPKGQSPLLPAHYKLNQVASQAQEYSSKDVISLFLARDKAPRE